MSFLRKILNKFSKQTVTLSFKTDPATAKFATSIIETLLANDEIGECLRCAVALLSRYNLPIVETYCGKESILYIFGPLQWTSFHKSFPLAGRIISSGISAELNSVEADELRQLVNQAVEKAICQYISEKRLTDQAFTEEFDIAQTIVKSRKAIWDWKLAEENHKKSSKLFLFEGGKHDQ